MPSVSHYDGQWGDFSQERNVTTSVSVFVIMLFICQPGVFTQARAASYTKTTANRFLMVLVEMLMLTIIVNDYYHDADGGSCGEDHDDDDDDDNDDEGDDNDSGWW